MKFKPQTDFHYAVGPSHHQDTTHQHQIKGTGTGDCHDSADQLHRTADVALHALSGRGCSISGGGGDASPTMSKLTVRRLSIGSGAASPSALLPLAGASRLA